MYTVSDVLSTARIGLSLGLSVVPVKADGTKAPAVFWAWLQYEPMYSENVSKVFRPGYGLALIGGNVSGNLEVIDFDTWDTYLAFEELARASGSGELLDRMKNGYFERTPRGAHLPYRCEQIAGNQKLALTYILDARGNKQTKAIIETRGEGGYAIIAPSSGTVHPSGKPYVLVSGSLATIPTLTPEERADLFTLARTFNEVMKEEESQSARTKRPPTGDRPGDVFNDRASWEEVLEPHGWVKVCEQNGESYWRRPGKDRGLSATTNFHSSDLLYIFSTSTLFESQRGYSKFAAYALLNHGGDFKKAAAALSSQHADKSDTGSDQKSQQSNRPPPKKAVPPRVTLRRPSELVARPISWRVEGLLPDGMLTVLHACDKLGKTILAWEVAWAILRNSPLFGLFAVPPGRVVLALLDDPRDLTVQRRDALGLTDHEDLRIVTPEDADLSDPVAFLADFKKACEEFRPQLVVIDALYHFAPSGRDSMNDAARMRGIMTEFNSLAETLPAAILLIAHDKKDGSDVAGSHVIRASAKALLHLTKPKWTNEEEDDGRRILTVVSKMTAEARHLLRCQGVGSWTYIGRGDSAHQVRTTWAQDRVLTWLKEGGEGMAQEIAKAVKVRKEDALSALANLEEAGQVSSDLRQSGGKGRPKRVYFIPTDGNENPKEKDGNENPPPLEPARIKGQSDGIFVPPAENQAETKINPAKPTTDAGFSESKHFRSQNLFSREEDGNDSFLGSEEEAQWEG